MRLKTLPIFLAFFVMGVADAMGPDVRRGEEDYYELSNVMSTLLSFFVFIAFAVFSVPGGLLAARIGKKNLLLLGLGFNAVAVLIPSVCCRLMGLAGLHLSVGRGDDFLQVSGNPIMRDVSAEGGYSRNLSFAQGIKGIGSTASTYWSCGGGHRRVQQSWVGVAAFPVFFGLMAVTFVSVALLKVEETKADEPPSIGSSLGLAEGAGFLPRRAGHLPLCGSRGLHGTFPAARAKSIGLNEDDRQHVWAKRVLPAPDHRADPGRRHSDGDEPRTFFRLSALLGCWAAAR